VDCGVDSSRLAYALSSTEPEGVCQSVSFYGAPTSPVPLGKLYTLGIQFFVGRAHAASLLPEVMALIEQGKLEPGAVATRVVGWDDAPRAYLEESIKLVVERR
jgi:alcohol dehydrogenase